MMSNSSLVSYTRISPNRTSPRKYAIDTITIHCVVGQASVETLGEIFAPTSREASSNYGVGYDGRIGMYVEEKDRSWCSGGDLSANGITGSENDHRAITIEVASDTTHPYAVNDKAYAALINLLADICKRNNIKSLIWKADKSLVGNISKQNMTVHRWFSYTKCPGDYLYERLGQIAKEVNAKLKTVVLPEGAMIATPQQSTEGDIFRWLSENSGLNTAAIAGILANLEAESGFNAKNLQNSYERSLGYTDDSYTAAVDSKKYHNFSKDSAGYGLAQWTYSTRKQGLYNYALSKKVSIGDYKMQLEYLLSELKNYKRLWTQLTQNNDLEDSAYNCGYMFCYDFEAPAEKQKTSIARGNRAKEYYLKYKDVSNSVQVESITYDSINVGDTYRFIGNKHYLSSSANIGSKVAPSRVKVIRKYVKNSKHPIHVRSINNEGKYISGVYGWVDIKDLISDATGSFLVKVTVPKLNYRSGPRNSYPVKGVIQDQGIYTIVDEENGWGKLKSGVGWIYLGYTKRV